MIGDEHILDVVARHEQTIAKQREVVEELSECLRGFARERETIERGLRCSDCGSLTGKHEQYCVPGWAHYHNAVAAIRKAEEVLG